MDNKTKELKKGAHVWSSTDSKYGTIAEDSKDGLNFLIYLNNNNHKEKRQKHTLTAQ